MTKNGKGKNAKTAAKGNAGKSGKAGKAEYINILGPFDSDSVFRNGDVANEATFQVNLCTLEAIDANLDRLGKSALKGTDVVHEKYEHLGAYLGTPPLGKNQKGFQTFDDCLNPRGQNKTGLAKWMNLNSASPQVYFEAFISVFVYELYLVRQSKTPKAMLKNLDEIKKIQPSLVKAICTLPKSVEEQVDENIRNKYTDPGKMQELFAEVIGNEKVIDFATKKLTVFLKFIGIQLSIGLMANKSPVNFKKLREVVEQTFNCFGYRMRETTIKAMMDYAEDKLKLAAKKRDSNKTVKGGKGAAGKSVARKMTEKERVANKITLLSKPAQKKKAAAKKKGTKLDLSSDEEDDDEDEDDDDDDDSSL